jgi:hypothetical protein
VTSSGCDDIADCRAERVVYSLRRDGKQTRADDANKAEDPDQTPSIIEALDTRQPRYDVLFVRLAPSSYRIRWLSTEIGTKLTFTITLSSAGGAARLFEARDLEVCM